MANLVSIDWSVEEFRRLISEQSKSSDAGSSIEKTVDVLNSEIAPTSETIDRVPPTENANSREAGAASERLVSLLTTQVVTQKKDRSSDSTVADVMALTALQVAGSDKPISSPEADRVRDIALHILNPEVAQPSKILDRHGMRQTQLHPKSRLPRQILEPRTKGPLQQRLSNPMYKKRRECLLGR